METELSKKQSGKIQTVHWDDIVVICFISIVSVFYFLGVSSVPFHPDEATQIFMSEDVKIFFTAPASLFFDPLNSTLQQHYREIDSPLTREVIGIARLITNTPGLKNDWDWSKSWDQNIANSAFPSQNQLLIARFAVAFVFPFSLFLLYLTGKSIQGRITGIITVILYSSNSLVLLHTRRAMAESLFLFFVILSIYLIFSMRKNLWLVAIPITFAINSKQFALILIPVAIFVLIFRGFQQKKRITTILLYLVVFFLIVISISSVLNPIFWSRPFQAIQSAIQERRSLTLMQEKAFMIAAPNMLMHTTGKQAAGILGNLFIQLPAIQDIGNYTQNLLSSSSIYLANPFHTILRSIYSGIILLMLMVSGIVIGVFKLVRKRDEQTNIMFLLIISASLFIEYFATVHLPFQRYIIIFVPVCILWIGLFFEDLYIGFTLRIAKKPVRD